MGGLIFGIHGNCSLGTIWVSRWYQWHGSLLLCLHLALGDILAQLDCASFKLDRSLVPLPGLICKLFWNIGKPDSADARIFSSDVLLIASCLGYVDKENGPRGETRLHVRRKEVVLLETDEVSGLAPDQEQDPAEEGPCDQSLSEVARARFDVREGEQIEAGGVGDTASRIDREEDGPSDESTNEAHEGEHLEVANP